MPMFLSKNFSFSFFINLDHLTPLYNNYTYKWYESLDLYQIKPTILRHPKSPCTFTPHNEAKADSTSDDIIIGSAIQGIKGVLPFITTYKQARVKAPLVIIVDTKSWFEIIKAGLKDEANYININEYPRIQGLENYQYKIPIFEFAATFGSQYKRLLITDLTDVVFQGDPFQKDQDWSKIYMSFELVSMYIHPIHIFWAGFIPNWKIFEDFTAEQINAGIMGGNGMDMMMFSRFVLYLLDYPNPPLMANDQAMIQYLRMNGFLDDCGLETETRGRNPIAYFHAVSNPLIIPFPDALMINSDEYASMMHKYYRINASKEALNKYCNLGTGNESFKES